MNKILLNEPTFDNNGSREIIWAHQYNDIGLWLYNPYVSILNGSVSKKIWIEG